MHFRTEDSVAGYLGILIDRKADGTIHITQQGLTTRIITALNLGDSTIAAVPTPSTGYLPVDTDGEGANGNFDYASIVSQLAYLQGHSRINIALAASQVARYVHKTKRSHKLSLLRIGHYSKGTVDKRLILCPIADPSSLAIDVYVDSSFAAGWGIEASENPESVKSRTGYIISLANCPVLWISKQQNTITTSTMEAEYIDLSMALQVAIPLFDIATSVVNGLKFMKETLITFKTTVHKDNQGALILANLESGQHTPRSKIYALWLHWFRLWTLLRKIKIVFIELTN